MKKYLMILSICFLGACQSEVPQSAFVKRCRAHDLIQPAGDSLSLIFCKCLENNLLQDFSGETIKLLSQGELQPTDSLQALISVPKSWNSCRNQHFPTKKPLN